MTNLNTTVEMDDLEKSLRTLSGKLALSRGQLMNELAISQKVHRKTVYFWYNQIVKEKRIDVFYRFAAALEKLENEKGV